MPKRIIGNPATTPMAMPEAIKDLGTFYYWPNPAPGGYETTSDKYNTVYEALNETKESGIYKYKDICFVDEKDGDIESITSAILFVMSGQHIDGYYESVVQIEMRNVDDVFYDVSDVPLPRIRHYYYDSSKSKYVWSQWSYDKYFGYGDETFGFENIGLKTQDMSFVDTTYYPNDMKYPSVIAVANYVKSHVYPTPITTIPTTLTPNKQYNFGEVEDLDLTFPTTANDGDVIYLTFTSGEVATNLSIDITNTCDIEVIPDKNTGYEIFGKYNGSIWIVNYSEYTVSEG